MAGDHGFEIDHNWYYFSSHFYLAVNRIKHLLIFQGHFHTKLFELIKNIIIFQYWHACLANNCKKVILQFVNHVQQAFEFVSGKFIVLRSIVQDPAFGHEFHSAVCFPKILKTVFALQFLIYYRSQIKNRQEFLRIFTPESLEIS